MPADDTSLKPSSFAATPAEAYAGWEPESRSAIVMDRGQGCLAWDTEGTLYLDMTSCSGGVPFGISHPVIMQAAATAIGDRGDMLPSSLHRARLSLVDRMRQHFPVAERSFFLRTGSCATTAATRIARAATGREVVLTAGFHGWHDAHQQRPWCKTPALEDSRTIDFGYDIESLKALLHRHRGKVAAVFMTPEPSILPVSHAREVGALAREAGALFMLDEVLCGLKSGPGGYHGSAGIDVDLVAFAKGLANGAALSAVCGRSAAMAGMDDAYLGNTYVREARAFEIAHATFDQFEYRDGHAALLDAGIQAMDTMRAALADSALTAWFLGRPTMFDVVLPDELIGNALYQNMRDCGLHVMYAGTHMISVPTAGEGVEHLGDRLREAIRRTERQLPSAPAAVPSAEAAIIAYAQAAFHVTQAEMERRADHWLGAIH